MAPNGHLSALTPGVRTGIEDARDVAARNVEHFAKEIAKAERDIDGLRSKIASMLAERAENEAVIAQAEAMLNGS